MAAPIVRGSVAAVSGGTTTSPSGTGIGDLVIVYTFERLGAGSASTLTKHSSMDAQLVNFFHNDGSTDGAFGVAAKVATQAGAQSYQGFTTSTGTPTWFTGCVVLQAGTYAFNPQNLAPIPRQTFSQTTNAVPDPPSVTLSSSRDYQVIPIAAWHLGSAATVTPTAPTNYVNLVHVSGSQTVELASSTRAITGATSENPGTYGDDVAPNGTCGCTIAIPNPSPATVSLGQASETDTSQAFARSKAKTIGEPSETDAAQALGRLKTRAVGQPAETDTSQAFTQLKTSVLGLVSVAESAFDFTVAQGGGGQIIPLGQGSETDVAQALAGTKTTALGLATQSESAQVFGRAKVRALAIVTETDIAQQIRVVVPQVIALGQAAEVDVAQSFSYISGLPESEVAAFYPHGGGARKYQDEDFYEAVRKHWELLEFKQRQQRREVVPIPDDEVEAVEEREVMQFVKHILAKGILQ